ncbi:MAG TPA: hypothetical protein VIG72_13225, partial [Pontibacter sp.]
LRFGIENVSENDLQVAAQAGARIRLAGTLTLDGNSLVARVLPALVESDNELYHVQQEANGVLIAPLFAGEQFLKGRGAGSHPTGSAVWADVSAALEGYRYAYPKAGGERVVLNPDKKINVYLRCPASAQLLSGVWEKLTKIGTQSDATYYTAVISCRDLQRLQAQFASRGIFVAEISTSLAGKLTRAIVDHRVMVS